ncbi:phBC6A51 family helix-turn-helix protein [Brevibacillus porteri]|uniref:phBC6A51 family helix-turn-helix protein n=1 Tax=Brevibacillus porteri TaxID=2126350 RepID=UPI003D1C44C1
MKRRKRGRPPRKELTSAQKVAIKLIVWRYKKDMTMDDVSQAVGVSRMAVWKWFTRCEPFIREYQREYDRSRKYSRRIAKQNASGWLRNATINDFLRVAELHFM